MAIKKESIRKDLGEKLKSPSLAMDLCWWLIHSEISRRRLTYLLSALVEESMLIVWEKKPEIKFNPA